MCFKIDQHATRPAQTTVFKVMMLHQVVVGALLPPCKSAAAIYRLGQCATPIPNTLPTSYQDDWQTRIKRSLYGYYVFASKKHALEHWLGQYFTGARTSPYEHVLVECLVDPLDWLHTAQDKQGEDGCMTYRTFTPIRIVSHRKDPEPKAPAAPDVYGIGLLKMASKLAYARKNPKAIIGTNELGVVGRESINQMNYYEKGQLEYPASHEFYAILDRIAAGEAA